MDESNDTCTSCLCLFRSRDAFDNAVMAGMAQNVQELLRKDIRLMKRRSLPARKSAWHLAAQKGHVGVLKALVHTVLNSSTAEVDNMMTSSIRRMLSISSTPEQLLTKFLLQGSRGGLTPLMLAALEGQTEAVAYLLSIGEYYCPSTVPYISDNYIGL